MFSLSMVAAILCNVNAHLWPQGIVHYAINKKDYDVHSQDVIMSTLNALQREICIKFFNQPGDFTARMNSKVLYISNPDKMKECPPQTFNYKASVIDMPIGYKCLDTKNIARIVVEMLRASVEQQVSSINSYDLIRKIKEREDSLRRGPSLLSSADRNYLNAHYFYECGAIANVTRISRRSGDQPSVEDGLENTSLESPQLSEDNLNYYRDLLWPLGIVMYGVDPAISSSSLHLQSIQRAMAEIELSSCVVFQPVPRDLHTENLLWFGISGEDMPELGFKTGNQSLKLSSIASGAPGHTSHTLNALLRALGLPMMSNRRDRDNYVAINWQNVMPGQEHHLERSPESAWLRQIPYDMTSATHAPANYMCRECSHPIKAITVQPLQDHLWQRTLSMGRQAKLSESDKKLLKILYGKECHKRTIKNTE